MCTTPLATEVQSLAPRCIALRHALHAHPEIRFEEHATARRIAGFLDELGVRYRGGYARGTGLVAEIGEASGPVVALRADMDALEITEETGLPYASTIPQRMHACGHDGHMAILCGAAALLHARRDALPGRVRLLFQPGEESAAGASYMVEEGVMAGVDAIFGLHGWPDLPLGTVGFRAGAIMASANNFEIVISGTGCHAAMPHTGVDVVYVAAAMTTALQGMVTRSIAPATPALLSITEMQAGSADNILPEDATLRGTFRSFDAQTDERLRTGLVRVAEALAHAHGARVEVRFAERPYPPTVNDAGTTQLMRAAAEEIVGAAGVIDIATPSMGAEDFAFYLREGPGTYCWLGLNPQPGQPYPALHNNRYDFNDDAIPIGIELMAATAMRALAAYTAEPPATK